mmetsp:Transcript_23920/g.51174  ORF Transcript_23920/g.51174 Transcript_23920/m.51174 type:complete len:238 (-) Transcript_23920:700-1413(-)
MRKRGGRSHSMSWPIPSFPSSGSNGKGRASVLCRSSHSLHKSPPGPPWASTNLSILLPAARECCAVVPLLSRCSTPQRACPSTSSGGTSWEATGDIGGAIGVVDYWRISCYCSCHSPGHVIPAPTLSRTTKYCAERHCPSSKHLRHRHARIESCLTPHERRKAQMRDGPAKNYCGAASPLHNACALGPHCNLEPRCFEQRPCRPRKRDKVFQSIWWQRRTSRGRGRSRHRRGLSSPK